MKIRDIAKDDPELKVWLDKAHGGRISPDVFFGDDKVAKVVEDSEGPVFFVRFTNIVRADIQFDPFATRPLRTAKGLKALTEYFDSSELASEVVTNSSAPALIGLMNKIGFKEAPDTFVRRSK